ncbi:ACT domain-containing protein [Kingella potus]|nr:ACT domain-containing protein [Kingella potus]UOP01869.1 ACT domain-containing protein [Kingella potus]
MSQTQASSHSVLTVIGKDRIGIVYDVSKLLAEHRINILNISQQLMDDYFTMIILIDTGKCPQSREEMLAVFAEAGKRLALDIRMQNEELFNAMHRI